VTVYVALLRAVNVGGRKLKMDDLKRIATEIGFDSPRTFIASGNLLFVSDKPEGEVGRLLEQALREHMGAEVPVLVRTAEEIAAVDAANPFAQEPGNKVVAIFLNDPPADDAAASAKNVADERLALGTREIYVHFPSGQGQSKMSIGAARAGTARNMNTVRKLAELAREMR
jgi:uncharacterized protein (DUF1697 family)